MTEPRERYITTDAQLTTASVPASKLRRCELCGHVVKIVSDPKEGPGSTCYYEPDESEAECLRAELRRLRVLLLWLRGDLTALEARESLGLPKGTVNSALNEMLAEARAAFGLER